MAVPSGVRARSPISVSASGKVVVPIPVSTAQTGASETGSTISPP